MKKIKKNEGDDSGGGSFGPASAPDSNERNLENDRKRDGNRITFQFRETQRNRSDRN